MKPALLVIEFVENFNDCISYGALKKILEYSSRRASAAWPAAEWSGAAAAVCGSLG